MFEKMRKINGNNKLAMTTDGNKDFFKKKISFFPPTLHNSRIKRNDKTRKGSFNFG